MPPEDNPADDDPHAECRNEIERLTELNTKLVAACKESRTLYDYLALGPLEAASKYGPDYGPPTDEDMLRVRGLLENALTQAENLPLPPES